MTTKIPNVIETYDESNKRTSSQFSNEPHIYEPVEGEKVFVYLWVQYPTYDFIFGTPAEDSPKYQKEFGFFQFRKKADGKTLSGWSIYVDQSELEEMQKGFTRLMDESHVQRTKEWSEYHANKNDNGKTVEQPTR